MLKRVWRAAMQQPHFKIVLIGGGVSMLVWSAVWSVTDGFLNLWPMVFWAALIALILFMTWATRNSQ